MVEDSTIENVSHFQVTFSSTDKRLKDFPEHPFNVPTTSNSEQFNVLVNKVAEGLIEDWEEVLYDFLINGTLLRTDLEEFVEAYSIPTEGIIPIECVQREPAPIPEKNIPDSEWVSDLKTSSKLNVIFSVNYGGELSAWNSNGDKLGVEKLDENPLKCLDVFEIGLDSYVVTGSQNQTLELFKLVDDKKSEKVEFQPVALFRGHARSVECCAAKNDGTRIVSGSFDQCLKVWNTQIDEENIPEINDSGEPKTLKKAKIKTSVPTKIPMVTLESHREAIVDIKWNPLNEKQVITVSWDHSIICWDLELAGPASKLHSNKSFTSLSVNSSTQTPQILTGSTDPIVRLWDLRSREGSMVKLSFLGHKGWVSDVCWSPIGSEHLFVSSSFDNTVKMWDTRSPKAPLYDLMGHEDRVLCVDWSAEKLIVSGSADSTIKTFRRAI